MNILIKIINFIVRILQLLIPVAIWMLIGLNFFVAIFSGFQETGEWPLIILFAHLATGFYAGISTLILMGFTTIINKLKLLQASVDFKPQLYTFKYYWITLLGTLFAAEIHFLQL